jgi:hypothetical protein
VYINRRNYYVVFWGDTSRDLKAQDELEKWIQEKLIALSRSNSVQEYQQSIV